MEKEFLVTKLSDQKKSGKYSYYRNLTIEDETINLDSFNQFIELETENKNLAFFVTDEIKFLSFANPKKFYKNYLKEYRDFINKNIVPQIFLDIKDEEIKEKIEKDGTNINVIYLSDEINDKIK